MLQATATHLHPRFSAMTRGAKLDRKRFHRLVRPSEMRETYDFSVNCINRARREMAMQDFEICAHPRPAPGPARNCLILGGHANLLRNTAHFQNYSLSFATWDQIPVALDAAKEGLSRQRQGRR